MQVPNEPLEERATRTGEVVCALLQLSSMASSHSTSARGCLTKRSPTICSPTSLHPLTIKPPLGTHTCIRRREALA